MTLVLGTEYASILASTTRPDRAAATWLVAAGAWKLAIASPAALRRHRTARLPRLDEAGPVSVAAWLAAALGCAEAFKHIGQLREGHGRPIEAFSVNLWTLTGSDGFGELEHRRRARQPAQLPAHYVVGAGAVAEAYLAVLATSDVTTALLLLDDDVLGDTNLNRHILAGWADHRGAQGAAGAGPAGRIPAADLPGTRPVAGLPGGSAGGTARPAGSLAAAEGAGRYGLVISAVDRNDSRISIAAARPQVILGGSTNGLRPRSAATGPAAAGSAWHAAASRSRCRASSRPPPSWPA